MSNRELPGAEALSTGHYFKLERGQWTKDSNWPPTFYQASGRTYIGCLTLEQRIELDALIDGYLNSRAVPEPATRPAAVGLALSE